MFGRSFLNVIDVTLGAGMEDNDEIDAVLPEPVWRVTPDRIVMNFGGPPLSAVPRVSAGRMRGGGLPTRDTLTCSTTHFKAC